jgi:hypothetical protein
MPPAYVALVACVYWLLGAETLAATAALYAINAIATALAVVFVFLITLRLSGPAVAWVAAAVAAVNPTLIGFSTYIWDTNLFCLGATVAAWMSLWLSERPMRWWQWLGFGLYLGVLALLNPALTIAYPFLVLWPISRLHGWRIRPVTLGVTMTILGWLVAITPWTVRNYVHFDRLIYIRGGFMLELWLGVCPEADANGGAVYRSQFPLLSDEVQAHVATIGEQAFIDESGERAREAIASDPMRLLRLTGMRAVDYYLGTVYSHTTHRPGGWPSSPMRAAIMLFLIAEGLVIIACLLVRPGLVRDAGWLLAIIISFSPVYCLTHVQVRFRAPTEPVTAVLLAFLLAGVFKRWMHRRDEHPDERGAVEE